MFFNRRIDPEIKDIVQDANLDEPSFRRGADLIRQMPQPFDLHGLINVLTRAGFDDDVAFAILILLGCHDMDETGVHAIEDVDDDTGRCASNYNEIVDFLANQL